MAERIEPTPDNLPEVIALWRSQARTLARAAQHLFDAGDNEDGHHHAVGACMFYLAAADADHFGDLPALFDKPDIPQPLGPQFPIFEAHKDGPGQ